VNQGSKSESEKIGNSQKDTRLKTLEGRIKELEHENDNLKALNEDLEAAKKEKEEIGCILEDFKALHKGIRVFFSGPFGRCVSDIQQSRVYKMPG
jgi:predicted RNase H-like nuclease (RuvC/YqgF family)